ncbi:hypothetical protein EUGRSUZ_C00746 [Eucalyptus grandis]|uniref:Uncharacterized protein n=2 Tax=Eucalyptus grandis TaxID=71139 RepID=A0ACC3LBG9_EUCGR|nr:hypothetical protein EUGRSUZ_C00746 [Eucalyptus grandis]
MTAMSPDDFDKKVMQVYPWETNFSISSITIIKSAIQLYLNIAIAKNSSHGFKRSASICFVKRTLSLHASGL